MAAVLAALCLNYKHFGGGLPDLLLVRAVRRTGAGSVVAREEEEDAVSARGVETARGVAAAASTAAPLAAEADAEVETETETEMEAPVGAEVSTVRSSLRIEF